MPDRTMVRRDARPSGTDPKRASRDRSRLKAALIGEGAGWGKGGWFRSVQNLELLFEKSQFESHRAPLSV